jgi:hypothetical protein
MTTLGLKMLFDSLLAALEEELRADFHKALAGLITTARTRLEVALVEVAQERAKGQAEVAKEKDALHREIEAMHRHAEQQEGRVDLNIGGYRFETSVQSLRRVPHTFFDAYFSGRYAQDVCSDGSIFVNRDGEHFGHVLEYMRDGVVSVAAPGARPSLSLLRLLKREFGFYCIKLVVEQPAEPEQLETAFVMGGNSDGGPVSSTERYDAASGQWSAAAPMITARAAFGACVVAGEVYATGGFGADDTVMLSSVEKYTPLSDTWSIVASMPERRCAHAAVAVGSAMYVVGGISEHTFKFDSMQGTWSEVAPMPERRIGCTAVAVGGDIYVFSGYDTLEQFRQASVFKYDTVTDEWSTLASMPLDSFYHSACVLGGLVYIVGAGDTNNEVLRFDPVSGVWSTILPTLNECKDAASFVLGGRLYVVGGNGSEGRAERYDIASDSWTAAAAMDMPEGRRLTCAVTIPSMGPAEEQDLFDSLSASRPLMRLIKATNETRAWKIL